METHVLSRRGDRPRSGLAVLPGIALARGRVHEICGSARRSWAAMVAGATQAPGAAPMADPVLWIRPTWLADRLYPPALTGFFDPGRLLVAAPQRAEDLLWCAEEALRSGLIGVVVADLPAPPGLTPVRRLQLAAEAGAAAGRPGLGLLLTPGDGGAAGVESRWHMAPRHRPGHSEWRLELRRARMAPEGRWRIVAAAADGPPAPGPLALRALPAT